MTDSTRRSRHTDEMRHGSAVRLDSVVRHFRDGRGEEVRAVDDVTLDIPGGAAVALTGPSGSGKSSLLHLIGAIDSADSGTITVDETTVTVLRGGELAAYRRSVGFVFQRYHLLPALTAIDNVMAPVLPLKVAFNKAERARELLAMVGLGGREHDLPSHMSGGQQQRVAIARALINDPALILADEPTGNLDSRTGSEIVELLLSLRAERGTTLLLATHDLALASRCDQVVRLRDGKVVESKSLLGGGSDETLRDIGRLSH